MNKKVLIIGGNSFIGFYTIKQFLKSGYDVTVTTRTKRYADYFKQIGVKNLSFDLNKSDDIKNLPETQFDSVILLAGLLPANVKTSTADLNLNNQYIFTNVISQINLLNYCIRNKIKKLISTTSYADTENLWDNNHEITESEGISYKYNGDHAVYVISKNTAAAMSEYYNAEYGMQNIIFRLPPVYGVGPHTQLFDNGVLRKSGIALFIEAAQNGENITIYGQDIYRDVVYVKDVAKAFVQATESSNASGLYNIMSGNSISLYEQAQVIADIFANSHIKIIRDYERKNNSKSYRYSIKKANIDFGYKPEYSTFKAMMRDYKKELQNTEILNFFGLEVNN